MKTKGHARREFIRVLDNVRNAVLEARLRLPRGERSAFLERYAVCQLEIAQSIIHLIDALDDEYFED